MTIAVRNRIILLGTALIAIFTAVFIVTVALLFRTTPLPSFDLEDQATIAPFAVSTLCELIYCGSAVLVLYFSFRKTSSAEMFLFILFLVSMSFDALKPINTLIDLTAVAPFFGTLVSRMVYFGRFFGVLCLFTCGLFTTGIPYERLELVLISGFLLALLLSATVPIDMTRLEANHLMPTIYERELGIISVTLYALALVNFILASIQTGNRSYLLVCAGVGMVIVGRELLFRRSDGFSIIFGFVMLIVGATLFGERIHEVHLWA